MLLMYIYFDCHFFLDQTSYYSDDLNKCDFWPWCARKVNNYAGLCHFVGWCAQSEFYSSSNFKGDIHEGVYIFHTNGVIDYNKPKYRVFVYVLGLKKSQITIHGKTNKSFSSYKLLYLLMYFVNILNSEQWNQSPKVTFANSFLRY